MSDKHDSELRGLFNSNADGMIVIDMDGVVLYLNPAAERLFARSASELLGVVLGFPIEGGATTEIEVLRRDGAPRVAEMRVVETRWEERPAMLATLRDISDRLDDQRRVRESEERLRAMIESMPDAVITADREGRIISCNAPGERMLGYAAGELVGKPLTMLMPESFRAADLAGIQRAAAALRTSAGPQVRTVKGLHRDGHELPLELSFSTWQMGEQVFFTGIVRDVTEREQLRAQIAQADRLASMGMLAAGVAHEINNPLSYTLFNLQTLTEDLPTLTLALRKFLARLQGRLAEEVLDELLGDDDVLLNPAMLADIDTRLADALQGTERIRQVTRGLGTFARVEDDQLVPVNLMHVVEVAINMAFNQVQYRARMVKDYGKLPLVMASEGRLSQVFLNLLINAAHAVDEGDVEKNRIGVRTWLEGDKTACVEISDTGKGIEPAHLLKLFDPFFTTKEIGVGSGLGLAISKNIIEGYGGTISVNSRVGEGTRFVVRIPVGAVEAAVESAQRTSGAPESQIRGRILVVDDERGIRKAIARMLRQHEIVEATNGQEALEILEKDQEFDLVLCDMMMPNVSGMVLHEWLVIHSPKLAHQFVFMTGGAFTPHGVAYLRQIDNVQLEKPFNPKNFVRMVLDMIVAARLNPWREEVPRS